MDVAIRAGQAHRRMVRKDPLTGEAAPLDRPDLDGLPDWVVDAYASGLLFVTHQDDYAGLWVETPYVVDGMAVYVRASMESILLRRGEGYVSVLGPCPWKFSVE